MPCPGLCLPGRGGRQPCPAPNIDGSVIVILSAAEARRVYEHLCEITGGPGVDALEHKLAAMIVCDLGLPPLE